MAKPRMVIVEKDLEHLIPIQLRVAEALVDIADLEIITESDYMETYFATPRTIDILVIEESSYSDGFSRHMIGKTYVLTENMGENDEPVYHMDGANGDVVCLFKYCNINTLIRYLIPFEWTKEKNSDKEPQLLAVISPSGGTGATTVSVGISACMKQNLKQSLYLNMENYQDFAFYMDNKSSLSMEGCNTLKNSDARIYEKMKPFLVRGEITYLPPLKNARDMLGIGCQNYVDLARAAQKSGDYDFIIVEIGNDLSTDALKLLNFANKVIVVVKQDPYSLAKLNVMKNSINCADKEKYVLVCNAFEKDKDNAFITGSEKSTNMISEYVEKFSEDISHYKCRDLRMIEGIQKLAITLL